MTASPQDIERIAGGDHHDPFAILGMHVVSTPQGQGLTVRAFLPDAESVDIVTQKNETFSLSKYHDTGFFELTLTNHQTPFPYHFAVTYPNDVKADVIDPYAFPPVLSDFDLHLHAEGNHHHIYDKLGAHPIEFQNHTGVSFAVWAPNARRVSVVGDFNHWNGCQHPMRNRGNTGIWEIFIPNLSPGTVYKFEIKAQNGDVFTKSDPYGFQMEHRPRTASIVHQSTEEIWTDQDWLETRRERDHHTSPMAIYEIHLGSWRRNSHEDNRPLTYRECAHELVDYVLEMGYTHIELLPVMEHPLDESWGYQVTGYFAPTSRFGTPEDFKYFVNHCHNNGIGVILDWVPAHFPTDAHGLAQFDGSAVYEHADPRQGAHPDWGTLIFNYARNEVRNFLIANALFWIEKYHIDGLRVDAVASMLYLDYSRNEGEWVPNRYGGRENLAAIEFMHQLNEVVHARFPGMLMIAEESTSWPGVSRPVYLGGLGFGFKWNMGWMNDTLSYIEKEPVHRKFHHDNLTFGLVYAFHENFILVLSHDEVVHGKGSLIDKMPGDRWQKFANLRLFYAFQYAHPGKKLLFMGGEFGQWREWDSQSSIHWHLLEENDHTGLQRLVKDLNTLYRNEPAFYDQDFDQAGFEWIELHDAQNSVISFLRRSHTNDAPLVFACNFTPVPRKDYRIGVPYSGTYREILNTDAKLYGGSNTGNQGAVNTEPTKSHDHPHSLQITLPPLAAVIFKPE
ncbi:MAG: 1,4-alpha-glucan branching protein GlgB [Candidatus Latescibacteria bacterium]|nr:1,4-alpha-glucan branching protein GlgB [Candidatus Latescibacterota bacterium]